MLAVLASSCGARSGLLPFEDEGRGHVAVSDAATKPHPSARAKDATVAIPDRAPPRDAERDRDSGRDASLDGPATTDAPADAPPEMGVDAGACTGGGRWVPLARRGAPSARGMHAAVWTGSEMLVFGGWAPDVDVALGDGGRYDARTDVWTPLPLNGSTLSPRRLMGSAWTGREWTIWGGNAGSLGTISGDGARFEPGAGTWTPMVTVGAPSPHYAVRLVWTGTEAMFWGGFRGGSQSNEGGRYDPVEDRWSPVAPRSPGGSAHAVVWTGTEYVTWSFTGTGGRYDPRSDTWRDVSSAGAPTLGQNPFVAWTGTEMIAWGGLAQPVSGSGEGGRYDPTRDRWTPMSADGAPSPRGMGAALWTGCRFLVWGGADSSDGTPLGDGAEYDPLLDRWTPLPALDAPTPRSHQTFVWTGTDWILWGGLTGPSTAAGDGARFIVRNPRQPRGARGL